MQTKDCDWIWSICNIPFQWSCFSQKHLDPIVWQTSVKTTMDYGSILELSELIEINVWFRNKHPSSEGIDLSHTIKENRKWHNCCFSLKWNWNKCKMHQLCLKNVKKTNKNNIHFIFAPCVKYISLWHQPTWYYFLTPVLFPTQILRRAWIAAAQKTVDFKMFWEFCFYF